jgi:hypothetical protein
LRFFNLLFKSLSFEDIIVVFTHMMLEHSVTNILNVYNELYIDIDSLQRELRPCSNS